MAAALPVTLYSLRLVGSRDQNLLTTFLFWMCGPFSPSLFAAQSNAELSRRLAGAAAHTEESCDSSDVTAPQL